VVFGSAVVVRLVLGGYSMLTGIRCLIGVAVCFAVVELPSAEASAKPPELGQVAWRRGFDESAKLASRTGKPLLVLFQEVPGCGTCVDYGQGVLSHPLIVEAAETLFVPVAVYNNIDGVDKLTLKSFDERAWNNPVVRIVSADRKPLSPRVGGDYSVAGLAGAMVVALKNVDQQIPAYLQILADESSARKRGVERATFAMHCFWEGEGALGKLHGVVRTMPGFVGGEEVVDVEFDANVINFESLVGRARRLKCASRVYTRDKTQDAIASKIVPDGTSRLTESVRPDKNPKYYLAQTAYKHVPMTDAQACRVNAAIGEKRDPTGYLSPRQLELLAKIKGHPSLDWPIAVGTKDLIASWAAANGVEK
jgi:Thioredoxin-like